MLLYVAEATSLTVPSFATATPGARALRWRTVPLLSRLKKSAASVIWTGERLRTFSIRRSVSNTSL